MPVQHTRRKQRKLTKRPQTIHESKRFLLHCFEKSWYNYFFTHHDLSRNDNIPAVEVKRNLGVLRDKLEIFLENEVADDLGSPCETDQVKRYSEGGPSLEDVESAVGDAGMRRAAWVDDRNSPLLAGRGSVRPGGQFLTANGLLKYLKQSRYGNHDVPDAERRLIYIADLTPDMILALAVTVPLLEAPALRDAICKHVSFRSSIRIHIPSHGKHRFLMEFHLPFFALRKVSSSGGPSLKTYGKPLRDVDDLTLVSQIGTKSVGQEKYRLYKAHKSIVLHGFDEWQYVVWAFEDSQHDLAEDEENGTPGAELDYNSTMLCAEVDEEPIIRGHDAHNVIWRPRQYFLKAFELHIKEFWEEWSALVDKLEVDKQEYKKRNPFTTSKKTRSSTGRGEELNASFHWTLQRMDLLTKLIDVLSGTISQWDIFISRDGDVGYLRDLDETTSAPPESHHAIQSLRTINETFKRLEDNLNRLLSLERSLDRDFSTLKMLLSLEGNAANEHSTFITNLTTWVLCPLLSAAGIFSMQPEVIPVALKFRYFVITIFILMFAMLIIQWSMKRWTLWLSQFILWINRRRSGEQEEELIRGLSPAYQTDRSHDGNPDAHLFRMETDIESNLGNLGTRVLSGRTLV